MATNTIAFTASVAEIVIGGHSYGPVGQLADLLTRDPVAATVWDEFNTNGTTSGSVVISAS